MIGARIAGIKKPRTMAGLSYPNVINLHVESRGGIYKKESIKSISNDAQSPAQWRGLRLGYFLNLAATSLGIKRTSIGVSSGSAVGSVTTFVLSS